MMNTVSERLLCALLVVVLAAGVANAQQFPSGQVRIIVPYAAGGGSDTSARLFSQPLATALGVSSVIVENKGGGGGLNGTISYLTVPTDGHTLLLGSTASMAIIPALRKVPYNAETDFVPLGLIWQASEALAVRKDLGVKTLPEFIDLAKKEPGRITVGSAGYGSLSHMAMELIKKESGIDTVHVPFEGGGPIIPQLLGGHIDAAVVDPPSLGSYADTGSLIVLAVTSSKRSPLLPNVPTLQEAGFAAGISADAWNGLVVSSKTPKAIIERLQMAVERAQGDTEWQQKLAKFGAQIQKAGAPFFETYLANEVNKWRSIVVSSKLAIDHE